MSAITFFPSRLHGCVKPPPSKSEAHRALLLAALGRGECVLTDLAPPLCDDTEAMLDGIRALGASVIRGEDSLTVIPAPIMPTDAEPARINVRSCAAALRMLIPVLLSRGQSAVFEMTEGLYRRPLNGIMPLIKRLNASAEAYPPEEGKLARLELRGFMPAGEYVIDGSLSSQYASGMIIALANARNAQRKPAPSRFTVTKPIVSRPYLDMTLRLMETFGAVCTEEAEGVFSIAPCEAVSPQTYALSGDWSQAAALLCANALGGGVMLEGMQRGGLQGDARILEVLSRMGLRIMRTGGAISAATPSRDALAPIAADCSDIPDIAPMIALACTQARGRSVLTGVGRLRAKECDRLAATVDLLTRMGARAEAADDALTVYGVAQLRGGFTADACGDHRMVMLLAIAASAADAPITVSGAEAVQKSWYDFIDVYRTLGGIAE